MPYYDYGLEDAPQATKDAERRIWEQKQNPQAVQSAQAKMVTDPVTGRVIPTFMNNPAVQRMQAMQAAGGTGRAVPPGGGGLGSLPMLQMLAPYLSQQGRGGMSPMMGGQQQGAQGGMSPLLAQLLPMLLAQQQQAGRRP